MKQRFRLAALGLAAVLCAGAVPISARAANLLWFPGDANEDGKITIQDAIVTARVTAEDDVPDDMTFSFDNADIDGDGEVGNSDILMLMRNLSDPEGYPLPDPVYETETATTTTTVTTAATTVTTATTAAPQKAEYVILDASVTIPLGAPVSEFTQTAGDCSESMTMRYKHYDLKFMTYNENTEHLLILIVSDDTILGCYAFCENVSLTVNDELDYAVTRYYDEHSEGSGKQYAALILDADYSLRVVNIEDPSNLTGFARLNYLALNAARALNGCSRLRWNETVCSVARAHSEDMAQNGYFDHKSPDGKTSAQRLLDAGIDWSSCAENIDAGYTDPFAALDGWYNSESGHRGNLLGDFTNVGIGFAYNADSQYGIYGTQDYFTGWN